MRVAFIVLTVVAALGLVGAPLPGPEPAFARYAMVPVTFLGGSLVLSRLCLPTPTGRTPPAWWGRDAGLATLLALVVTAGVLATASPVGAVLFLLVGVAAVHLAVRTVDAVNAARPLHVARAGDVERMRRFELRHEAAEASSAGLAAGIVTATAYWVGAVVGADLQLVPPSPAVLVGCFVGAVVAAIRAAQCLPAALRLQYAVTGGELADHLRLFWAVRRGREAALPPELAAVVPLWASRALAVSAVLHVAGPPYLVAGIAFAGWLVLLVWPTWLAVTVLLVFMLLVLRLALGSRLRHDDLLERAAAVPPPARSRGA